MILTLPTAPAVTTDGRGAAAQPAVAAWLPPAALVLVAVIWGVAFTAADSATAVLPPADLVAWRFGLGAVLLTLVTRSAPPPPAGLRGRGLVLGGLLGLGFLLQTWGLTRIDALTSGFLAGLQVVVAPVAAWLLFREQLGRASWVGVVLATAGLMVLSLHRTGFGVGELLTLAAAAAWGLHVVLLSRWSVPGHTLRLASTQTAAVAGLALVVVVVRGLVTGGSPLPVLPPDGRAWGSVLFFAVLASAAAMALVSWAQSRISATRAAVILTLEPAVAGVTAALAGAALTGRTVVGAAVLLGAMVVVAQGGRAPAPLVSVTAGPAARRVAWALPAGGGHPTTARRRARHRTTPRQRRTLRPAAARKGHRETSGAAGPSFRVRTDSRPAADATAVALATAAASRP